MPKRSKPTLEAMPEAETPPDDGASASRAESVPAVDVTATPSMAQFLEIKAANPDSLLWYRMGDFYELFFEDAIAAAEALSIVLTKRGKHQGADIPMCGVPVHRADEYLQRLIRKGFRVAVCEQLEDPAEARKRGSKAVVKRDVVRLVTPGTLTEEALLEPKARNYLTAVFRAPARANASSGADVKIALASIDISTGDCEIGAVAAADFAGELVRLAPSEVLATDAFLADRDFSKWIEIAGGKATPVPSAYFDSLSGERDIKERLGVADLAAFGVFDRLELAAAGALLKYIDLTQMGRKPLMRAPRRSGSHAVLTIDPASRVSLELVASAGRDKGTTLFAAIDRTLTGAGARELQARLSSPLAIPAEIDARLDALAYLVDRKALLDDVREALRTAPDVARSLGRLAFGRGSPRDLGALRDGLDAARRCAILLDGAAGTFGLPVALADIQRDLHVAPCAHLADKLRAALGDDLPHVKRDGGFVRAGYSSDLDDARRLSADNRSVLAALEARYVEETGIKALKVRHNNILGYFVEVTQLNAKPLLSPPLSDVFKHRQTMANAVRFTSVELVDIEGRIAAAGERALALEQEIFADLARDVAEADQAIGQTATALAALDVTSGLAAVAIEQGYNRPIVDDSEAFDVQGGRHPVVEQALARALGSQFIENNCVLGRAAPHPITGFDEMPDARIWLVTGPNMAGKSTFLRQNALIAILAQIGSFVPARHAHIGVIDRLFSRVGASDDLARGRSTFMVEMVETAAILNQATERSLVILDEIGRGTATFDGLSIAWATVEYLHDVTRARALFATHYHELTVLARRMPGIANVTMDVSDWQDEIIFLHKVKAGAADRSYGIQVAKLAGLPDAVIRRARDVLVQLEKRDRRSKDKPGALDDLPLFAALPQAAAPPAEAADPALVAIQSALQAINPDELSPKDALARLYELKSLAAIRAKPR
ncbi:MAG: DNA mismatch repair protein MutS [Hyphomicrobium sp.]